MYLAAQPALRSPGAPKYEDICFSPRNTSWGGRDIVEVAKAFHATRIEWLYVDDADGPVLKRLQDLGISLGLAISGSIRDGTEHVGSPHGFNARPQYYTQGRMLNEQGEVVEGWGSMHDPLYEEVVKRWLRLCGQYGTQRLHRDGPEWNYQDWDFNPHALRQFNDYLTARVPAEALARLDVGEPSAFDLKAYLQRHTRRSVPPEFRKLWEDFRRETLLAWYQKLREWTAEIVGPGIEWSANYSSFIQFTPERTWSDFAMTELQPSGGQFGIGDPWSLHRKVQISRELGKALVVTLGSHDVYENKIMIGLTYAMGIHMLCPYAVFMKDKPRKFDDPALYADVYGFVHRGGKTCLAGYEEAFALGNGILHPLTRHGDAPIRLEDPADSVYAFVRARPGQPDAPVVIHLVNWSKTARPPLAITLDPVRFFPGRGLKLSLLRPGRDPEILSDGWQARVELPSPAPWAMLVVEPASPDATDIWTAEVETEDFGFFDQRSVVLRTRTPGAAIHYTLDDTEPTTSSPRYVRALEIQKTTILRARVFAGGRASRVSSFTFTQRPANHLATTAPPAPGLTYELREGVKLSAEPDLDDPMKWAGGKYQFTRSREGRTDTITLPDGCPKTMFSVVFAGLLEIPRDGLYTFFVNADDECRLYVNDVKVIDLSGRKVPPDLGMTELQGRRLLSQGLHSLRIEYVQMRDACGLEVQWQGPGIGRQAIPPNALKHSNTAPPP
jgi:hypothetical protein